MTDAQDAEHKALALRDLRAALDTVYTDVWRVIDALGDAITSEQRRDLRVSAEIPDMKVDVRYSPTGDKGATFSPCSGYRYALAYSMPVPGERTCAFVMLNPSTADELEPDPTVRRCMGFANRIGRHLGRQRQAGALGEQPARLGADVSEGGVTSRITRTPGVQGGKPCIRDTNIRTKTVYKLYRDGWSMVRLLGAFSSLSPDQIVAAIEYEARRRAGIGHTFRSPQRATQRGHVKESFGQRIRRKRTEAKLGLRETATKVGISPTYLSRTETAKEKTPPAEDVIRKLAELLDDDFDELMTLAGRISERVGKVITADSTMPEFLRTVGDRKLSGEDLMKLLPKSSTRP